MSIKEELLVPTIKKATVIKVLIVAGLLITTFAFSTYFLSLIFDTQRIYPSDELDEAEDEDAELMLPDIPWDWEDLLASIDPEDLEDLGIDPEDYMDLIDEEDIEDILDNMFDGDIDDLDLTMLGLAIIALLLSDVEVFWISNYDDSIDERTDILWKYECFDEFKGDEWECTVPKQLYSFYDYDDYDDDYSNLDMITLEMPLSPEDGLNSFVIPSLFPNPYIMEDIDVSNVDDTVIYKNDFNSTVLDLIFNDDEDVDLIYELFGLDLPDNDDINDDAVEARYTPDEIQDQFIQLPPSIDDYIDNNPNFEDHYNNLNAIIDEDNDNTFLIANTIRNYLQSNFELGFDAYIDDPPEDGEDVVEWFCEKEEGLFPEFASAFCAFTRTFGVASRFVDGFNSRDIEEFDDNGVDTYAIKFKNIYHWAEIYVPTDTNGDGMWVQMDILYDSYGPGGNPLSENYDLDLYSNFSADYRGNVDFANLTAILTSLTGPGIGRTIDFYDLTTQSFIGSDVTDDNGEASILVPIDDAQTVGPHIIEASFLNPTTLDISYADANYTIYDSIEVIVTSVNPQDVFRTVTNETNIQGYVYDPVSTNNVNFADLEFVLFEKGTDIRVGDFFNPAFNPPYTSTDQNGQFDLDLTVNQWVGRGEYEIRVDFNGTWGVGIFNHWSMVEDSSIRFDLNVTEDVAYKIWFYINNTDAFNQESPRATRGSDLKLKLVVYNETDDPQEDVLVEFRNSTSVIGSNNTNQYGVTSIIYPLTPQFIKAGPNFLSAKIPGTIFSEGSYFILDEAPKINLNPFNQPIPREINRAGLSPTEFSVSGNITDQLDNPIGYSYITLKLFTKDDPPLDRSWRMVPFQSNPFQTGSDGVFNLLFGVASDTPAGNYSLRLDFNGTIFRTSPLTYFFNLPYLNTSTVLPYDLRVVDPDNIIILLVVNGTPALGYYDNGNPPNVYKHGDLMQLNVTIIQSGSLAQTGTIRIWDDYTSQELDNHTIIPADKGFWQFNISTGLFYAGLHRIRVTFEQVPIYSSNYTYIVVNESVNIYTYFQETSILRDVDKFTVNGYVIENGNYSRGLQVRLILLDSSFNDVSNYLNFEPGYQQNMTIWDDGSGYFEFRMENIGRDCPQGNYFVRIDFNGTLDVPTELFLTNFMVHNSSDSVMFNVTAGTRIIEEGYHTEYGILPQFWINGDRLYIYGNLTWDNGTGIAGMTVNITVTELDGTTIIAYNDTVVTDSLGRFNGSLDITLAWPNYRTDTRIFVSFNPQDDNNFSAPEKYYVVGTKREFTI